MILVFLALGMVGVLFLAISMFAGHDLHLDASVHEGATGFLSTRTLGVFLTGFGAVGAVATLYLPAGEAKGLVASLLGVLSGVVLSGIYLAAMHLIQSQEASSLVGDRDLVGLEGHVTVAIPENGVGTAELTRANEDLARARAAAEEACEALRPAAEANRLSLTCSAEAGAVGTGIPTACGSLPSRGTAGAASRSRRKHPGDRDHRARE